MDLIKIFLFPILRSRTYCRKIGRICQTKSDQTNSDDDSLWCDNVWCQAPNCQTIERYR